MYWNLTLWVEPHWAPDVVKLWGVLIRGLQNAPVAKEHSYPLSLSRPSPQLQHGGSQIGYQSTFSIIFLTQGPYGMITKNVRLSDSVVLLGVNSWSGSGKSKGYATNSWYSNRYGRSDCMLLWYTLIASPSRMPQWPRVPILVNTLACLPCSDWYLRPWHLSIFDTRDYLSSVQYYLMPVPVL